MKKSLLPPIVVALLAFCTACQAVDPVKGAASPVEGKIAAQAGQGMRDLEGFNQQLARFSRRVESVWGSKEREIPQTKRLVKYQPGYASRVLVDFSQNWLRVETVGKPGEQPAAAGVRLKETLVAALLMPGDPQRVELYSDQPELPVSGAEPFLHRQVKDAQGRPILDREGAERLAGELLARGVKQRRAALAEGEGVIFFLEHPLAPDHWRVRVEAVRPLVEKFSAQYRLNPALVQAIIHTECAFNRLAVSPAPAFGYMQIVPSTAGKDAWRRLHGGDEMPTPAYLLDRENNLRMGTLYLSMLWGEMLAGIKDPEAREAGVIASYHAGVGRMLRSFHNDKGQALAVINALTVAQYRQRLMEVMPPVTRAYLTQVLEAKKLFGK